MKLNKKEFKVKKITTILWFALLFTFVSTTDAQKRSSSDSDSQTVKKEQKKKSKKKGTKKRRATKKEKKLGLVLSANPTGFLIWKKVYHPQV